jgi:hypothetical protein
MVTKSRDFSHWSGFLSVRKEDDRVGVEGLSKPVLGVFHVL